MITKEDINLLAELVQRAGMTRIEVIWANATLNKMRAMVLESEAKKALTEAKE